MRASRVVRRTKYCWIAVSISSTPKTTNVAMVRLSSQAHVEPANVKAKTKHTRDPVLRIKPAQSMRQSCSRAVISEEPGGLIEGRYTM